jgi:hypothetical protein
MKTTLSTTILLLFAHICLAQDFWMQLDVPENFVGRSMDANSLVWLFVGTNDGVYRSTENGFNLSKIGLENVVLGLTIDIQDNIFAGSGPIYLSSDNGELWNEITTPSDVNVIYAKEGIILYGFWGGIYKSTNNGDTWEQTLEISNAKEVASIIETTDGTMYAGITAWSVPGGGVYRSMDNGDTWEHAGLWNHYIRSLATNSQGTLFAGSIGDGVGIYSSDDSGETWKGLKNDVFVTSIVVTPEDAIYIGCSNEHGTQGGVFRSLDDGETWEMINTGLIGWENQNIYGLTLSPNGYLYAYGNHLHRSIEPVFETVCSVTATANPPEGGSTSGTGEYNQGQTATLSATANEGYAFVNWADTLGVVLSTDSVYSFTVVRSIKMIANFEFTNSIQHHTFRDISMYPNPASDRLHISIERPAIEHQHKTLFISDMQGRGILTQSFTGNSLNVSLESFSPGVYLVYIMTGQNVLRAGKVVVG